MRAYSNLHFAEIALFVSGAALEIYKRAWRDIFWIGKISHGYKGQRMQK